MLDLERFYEYSLPEQPTTVVSCSMTDANDIVQPLEGQGGLGQITGDTNQKNDNLLFVVSPEHNQKRLAQPDFIRWPDMGYPPIIGGAPSQKDTKGIGKAEMSRAEAKAYIEAFCSRKWNRRRDEKELNKTLKEVSRLNRLYPGLRNEVIADSLESDPVFVEYIAAMKRRGETPDLPSWQAPEEIKRRFGL